MGEPDGVAYVSSQIGVPVRIVAVVGLVTVVLVACGDDTIGVGEGSAPRGGPPLVSATVEVVGDAPLTVSVVGVEPSTPGSPAVLRVTLGTSLEAGVVVSDLRWMFAVDDDSGLLAVAGPGCEPRFTAGDEVAFTCSDEVRTLELRPDAPVVDEIRVYVSPEGFPVAYGVFTFTQPITWALLDDGPSDGADGADGAVLLTVEVSRPGV